MHVVFIYNGAENLGIEHISSCLKSKGHKVDLLFDPAIFSGHLVYNSKIFSEIFSFDKKIIDLTLEAKPDIVGFSVFTGNYRWCLNIAREIKKASDIPIVFGGIHATAVPQRVLENEFVDFVVIGEGELAMIDLVENLEDYVTSKERINAPNICFKNDGEFHRNNPGPYIRDLDGLPFPDKSLFFDKVPMLQENYLILTSRGCPYRCTYCSNCTYQNLYSEEKSHIRRRSPDNVIEELLYYAKGGRTKRINFNDDVFTLSKKWLEEFLEKYRSKIALPFYCQTHPLLINKETIALLKEGGCRLMTLGVQSGSERVRKEIFNRLGSNERLLELIAYFKEAGIQISLDNIFGAPSESEDDLHECLEFYNKAKADRVQTFWLTYYPKTKIIDYAKSYGVLSDADIEKIEEGFVGFTHDTGSMTREKVQLYMKYQVLFHLHTIIHNDFLYSILSRLLLVFPFKKTLAKLLILLNALKIRDDKLFYLLKYLLAKKNVP